MATGYLSPIGLILQAFTDQGVVLSGGKIYTYVAGTTTPVTTYTSSTLVTPNANPIVLQSNGRLPASVWVPSGTVVKMVLQDSNGNTISGGTVDNLPAINDVPTGTLSTLAVSGNTTVGGTLVTTGATTLNGGLTVAGNTALTGTLTVNGSAATPEVAVAFSATAMTVNCALSNVFGTTLTANVTVAPTLSNAADGQTINWWLTQDGTGSRTMTWPASFKWPGASAGVLTTTASAVDLLVGTYRAATSTWQVTLTKAFG